MVKAKHNQLLHYKRHHCYNSTQYIHEYLQISIFCRTLFVKVPCVSYLLSARFTSTTVVVEIILLCVEILHFCCKFNSLSGFHCSSHAESLLPLEYTNSYFNQFTNRHNLKIQVAICKCIKFAKQYYIFVLSSSVWMNS